jgi:hypothetical protein
MKKTLLEHHSELRIESLLDDPSVNYEKRLVTVEHLHRLIDLNFKYSCLYEVPWV